MKSASTLLGCIVAIGLAGCSSARFVSIDKDSGVVAIPRNTDRWPTYYRSRAEALIATKCPKGYEIVHEGEAVTGQTSHTETKVDTQESPTLLLGGSEGNSKKTNRGERISQAGGGVAVPLGKTRQVGEQTTNVTDITEWHIMYRAK